MSTHAWACAVVVSLSVCTGQPPAMQMNVAQRYEGRLVSDDTTDRMTVEVFDGSNHNIVDRTMANRDGSFLFSAQPGNLYEIRVISDHGVRVHSEHLVLRQGERIELKLPKSRFAASRPGGAISVLRLSHKPMKSAMKMYKEADTVAAKGDAAGAVEQLKKVVEADPNWFEAWNNLGGRLLAVGQLDEAARAYRRAIEIDSRVAAPHNNLGVVLLLLRQPAEAEIEGRKALQLEPDSVKASYVLGLSLLQQKLRVNEGLALLRHAATVMPRAELAVAEWYCVQNEVKDCAGQLQSLLAKPETPVHATARRWLDELNKNRLLH